VTFSPQGKTVKGFGSLCLQYGCFFTASLSAFVGRKEDSEKYEDSSRCFIVLRQKIITEKSKSLLQTPARIENRIFPANCKAITGRLGETSCSKEENITIIFKAQTSCIKNYNLFYVTGHLLWLI